MKNKLTNIYIKISPEKQEAVFSGVGFVDFIECTPIPIENMLLMKSGYIWEKDYLGFEIAEGKKEIDNLAKSVRKDKFKHGDFSFVDYAKADSLHQLSDEQIAELLYLAHMTKPLKSPFFESLQNNFVYLSHDDDWYCKLYYKEWQIPISILLNKFRKIIQEALCDSALSLPDDLADRVNELAEKGLLIQVDASSRKRKAVTIKLYEVGEYENMDVLFNSLGDIMPPASHEVHLANS